MSKTELRPRTTGRAQIVEAAPARASSVLLRHSLVHKLPPSLTHSGAAVLSNDSAGDGRRRNQCLESGRGTGIRVTG